MDPSFLSRDDSNTFLVVIHVSNQIRPRQDTDMYDNTDFLSYFLNHIGKYCNDPKFPTDRSGQTVQTQIIMLLQEQSDQCLHCLLLHSHLYY